MSSFYHMYVNMINTLLIDALVPYLFQKGLITFDMMNDIKVMQRRLNIYWMILWEQSKLDTPTNLMV